MALIFDPDDLTQGAITAVSDAVWGTPTGATVAITSAGTNLPALTAGMFFEVRDHSDPENNGLYVESGGTPTTGSVTADKVTGSNPIAAASEAVNVLGNSGAVANEKSVHVDTATSDLYLLEQGNLSVDGVTLQAAYSFLKEEWKDDTALPAYEFPLTAITPEQFEFREGWTPRDNAGESIRTVKLIRTGGWSEINASDITLKQYAGVITLGSFEDETNDNAYYAYGTDATVDDTVNFDFNGPVNEAILTFEELGNPATCDFATTSTITRASGSFITDGYKVGGQVTVRNADQAGNNGTFTLTGVVALTLTVSGTPFTTGADTNAQLAVDNRNAVNLYLRVRDGDPNGKTFDTSNLPAIGLTTLTNKAERFPLSNATDLKIAETDANISANSPYTQIELRYFDQAFSVAVDTPGTPRDFGVVIDVGTHSGVDGSTTSAGATLTTAEGGITGANFTAGSLTIHEGANAGSYTISGTPTATVVTITTTFGNTLSNQSFSLQRTTPIVATAEEIYEKVQFELRQATDIDDTDQTVIGKTAEELLSFVGDTLEAGRGAPSNPNGGGSGVTIIGFDSNDTNRLTFFDNTAASRQFPFVAAGTISFNPNAVNDTGPGEYTMFFDRSTRTAVADLAISGASGSTASIDSAGANFPTLVQNDYVRILGATNEVNNGIWRVTDATPSTTQFDASKWDEVAVVNETAFAGNLDENPIDSPGAIIADNNSAADITGNVAASVAFDFDYDNNTQGGRTAATDAEVVVRFTGTDTGQNTQTTHTITRAVGQSISVVAGLERNYSNP